MMPFEENGVKVHFPDENYFQLGECEEYRRINGYGVKEMDICWHQEETDVLWFVELKAFDNPTNDMHIANDLSINDTVDYWLKELERKAIHMLGMFDSKRTAVQPCIPAGIGASTTFKLVFLINPIPGQETHLQTFQDQLRVILRPVLKIHNVSTMTVIPYNLYKNSGEVEWIVS